MLGKSSQISAKKWLMALTLVLLLPILQSCGLKGIRNDTKDPTVISDRIESFPIKKVEQSIESTLKQVSDTRFKTVLHAFETISEGEIAFREVYYRRQHISTFYFYRREPKTFDLSDMDYVYLPPTYTAELPKNVSGVYFQYIGKEIDKPELSQPRLIISFGWSWSWKRSDAQLCEGLLGFDLYDANEYEFSEGLPGSASYTPYIRRNGRNYNLYKDGDPEHQTEDMYLNLFGKSKKERFKTLMDDTKRRKIVATILKNYPHFVRNDMQKKRLDHIKFRPANSDTFHVVEGKKSNEFIISLKSNDEYFSEKSAMNRIPAKFAQYSSSIKRSSGVVKFFADNGQHHELVLQYYDTKPALAKIDNHNSNERVISKKQSNRVDHDWEIVRDNSSNRTSPYNHSANKYNGGNRGVIDYYQIGHVTPNSGGPAYTHVVLFKLRRYKEYYRAMSDIENFVLSTSDSLYALAVLNDSIIASIETEDPYSAIATKYSRASKLTRVCSVYERKKWDISDRVEDVVFGRRPISSICR